MSNKKRKSSKSKDKESATNHSMPLFNPFEKIQQPEWIEKKFPDLVKHQNHHHLLTSTRHLSHKGHQIAIKTTYEITIDGKKLLTHAMVDKEGRLWCHAMPYISFASANEMVKNIIDRYWDVIAQENVNGNNEEDGNDSHHHQHEGEKRK